MADSFSFGEVKLVASTDEAEAPAEPIAAETPFRILVVGDFRGREYSDSVEAGPGLAGRRPVRIDRDDLDRVLAGLGAELRLPVSGEPDGEIVLSYRELEDFRPERIYERVDVFRSLRELRSRLMNPSTVAETLRQLGASRGSGAGGPAPAPRVEPAPAEAPPPADLLSRILEESKGRPAPKGPAGAGPLSDFLAQITAPSRADAADPRQAEALAGVDKATANLLRQVLHHPEVQALEASWRSLDLLVRRLETDESLTISMLDATRDELEADLGEAGDPRSSGLHRLLARSADEGPWAVIVVDLTFDATREDIALLGRLAALGQGVGAPVLAAARSRFLGRESLAADADPDDWGKGIDDPSAREAWEELRRRPESAYLGLALPGVLLRLPYGREHDTVDTIDFEEMDREAGPGRFLWGNPAYLLAVLLGQAFTRSGWQLRPGEVRELDDLPLYIAGSGEDAVALPCAGVCLSDRAAESILDHGLMPMQSARDRDIVRVGRFQSVAEPSRGLAGRWTG